MNRINTLADMLRYRYVKLLEKNNVPIDNELEKYISTVTKSISNTVSKLEKIDELNVIPIEQYFDEMELQDFQKEERIEMAEEFEDLFFWFMYLWYTYADENGTFDKNAINDRVERAKAVYWAENEANTICNYTDFTSAVEMGYTTKTWITMKDDKVRLTHEFVDEETIPIDDYFMVGNSKMRYPRDIDGSAEEIIGCRCSIIYS